MVLSALFKDQFHTMNAGCASMVFGVGKLAKNERLLSAFRHPIPEIPESVQADLKESQSAAGRNVINGDSRCVACVRHH